MRRFLQHRRLIRFTMALSGGLFLLNGCDPTIRSTVENGIITVTNSFITSLFQAGLQVAADAGSTP